MSNVLKEVATTRNLSLQDLADMSGIPVESIKNIYYDKVHDPKASTLLALSKALDLSINYLLGDPMYKSDELDLIQYYRRSSERGKAVVRLFAKVEADLCEVEKSTGHYVVSCLIPIGPVEDGIIYHNCDSIKIQVTDPRVYLAIEITTNYFATAYCRGDRILLENRFPKSGERAVFLKGKMAYFRLYLEEGDKYLLRCLNGNGADIVLKRPDEVTCIGTCIGVDRS